MKKRVCVIYDSKSGHTKAMAEAVAEGASAAGADVVLKHVDEALPEDLFSDGIIVGSPSHCGLPSWKIKKFFDDNVAAAWGKVGGRIGAAFCSSGGLGGGNELAAMGILNLLLNYGYLVFGLPDYAAPGVTAHYGAVAVGKPGDAQLKSCRLLGQRMAEHLGRMGEGS
jgi:NAD(P)H dehydrogenase (quinone)